MRKVSHLLHYLRFTKVGHEARRVTNYRGSDASLYEYKVDEDHAMQF